MRTKLVLAALALFLLPAAARADAFQITSGAVSFSRTGGPRGFVLSGPGFQVTGFTDVRPAQFQNPVSPGGTGVLFLFADSADGLVRYTSVTADGVTFTSLDCGPCAYFRLQFNAPAFTAPGNTVGAFVVIAPFTAAGSAQLFTGSGPSGNPLFVEDFAGAGTVRADYFFNATNNAYFLQSLTYTFGPQAEGLTVQPVPEPATFTLLGMGLWGVGVAAHRRRKAR